MIMDSFLAILLGALIGIMVGSTLGSLVSYYIIRKLLMRDKLVQEMFTSLRAFRKKGFSLSVKEKVVEVETKPEPVLEPGRFYSIREVAKELGFSISWITKLIKRKRLKAVQPFGYRWRIPQSEVDRARTGGF